MQLMVFPQGRERWSVHFVTTQAFDSQEGVLVIDCKVSKRFQNGGQCGSATINLCILAFDLQGPLRIVVKQMFVFFFDLFFFSEVHMERTAIKSSKNGP